MSQFDPHVLPEDRERVINAFDACWAEKNRIYAQHRRVAKLAYLQDNDSLMSASEAWQEAADLKVSTEFDCIHLEAQARRNARRRQPTIGISMQLKRLRERRDAARAAFPSARAEVERLYAEAEARGIDKEPGGFF